MLDFPRRHIPKLTAVLAGLIYALSFRLVFNTGPFKQAGGLLMLSFLVAVPLGLGVLAAHFTPKSRGSSWRYAFAPWVAVTLFILTAFVAHLEGAICLIIIFPLFFFVSWAGARLYAFFEPKDDPDDRMLVSAVLLLPLLTALVESQVATPDSRRRVENVVDIAAPPAAVWQHIIRVPPIRPADLGPSLVDRIGFPRPVEATLTHEGLGGVRHATFERGVEFTETVDEWVPQRKLSFSIEPNTATIPPTTFDEHVTVGGRFFDVLRGTYELQPLPGGRTRLILYSQQRLSTRLNLYAGLWTDYVMSEIQRRILQVVKRRCETAAPPVR
jgi:hypothetical protein